MTELERKISRLKQLPINRAKTNKILAEILITLLTGESDAVTPGQLEDAIDSAISAVLPLDGSREMAGDLHMGEQKVINMGDPTNARDGVNLQTMNSALAGKADTSSLAGVATSGNYSDLSGTPTIPTNNNQLTNGAGYITSEDIPAIPSNTSDLVNDSGFITSDALPDISGVSSIADPTTATTEDVANKINELITALQS